MNKITDQVYVFVAMETLIVSLLKSFHNIICLNDSLELKHYTEANQYDYILSEVRETILLSGREN